MKRNTLATLLAAACCLVSVAAHAQTAGTNTVERNGFYFNATTGQQTDVNGNVLVTDAARDRDAAVLTGAGLNGVSIASGQVKQALEAVGVGSWGKFDLLLSWSTAAAADSDSVAISIKVYGKTSSSPGDGLNYTLAPARTGGVADTGRVVLPAGVKAVPWFAPPTFLVLSAAKLSGGANINLKWDGTGRVVTVPWHCIRWTQGTNAVGLNLADVLGDFAYPYLLIEVANVGNTNLTNVTATWSPRVN